MNSLVFVDPMKITIDVDITPRELRSFFGLPDIKPLQDELLERIQEKMSSSVEGFDVLNLMKPLVPPHMQSLDVVQKAFWQMFSNGKTTIVNTEADNSSKSGGEK
uniref:Uncharacterized protein n=1 Tax=Candidatus Kentrum sp. MB TaxID=2138164 RepID=A0A450XHI8_9GAMM|nr:MAG: hypothetical protein BECKMB1821G_GA0114241_100225 [Candidatus Kentron sp. MB]VFK28783.1 MAG: hypothetical protein BECKMB1821I_GA0114274_100726 [Candidatus Kentron sp. MB]VFK74094.1 MAG: hypothetical protein BECKMB1821H_GA0114242_100125 [Candidatus Kentron sp. MB]